MSGKRDNDQWLSELLSKDSRVVDDATKSMQEGLRRAILAQFLKRGLSVNYVEDIVQEASLRVFEQLNLFRRKCQFMTWATSIAVRTGMEMIRRGYWEAKSISDFNDSNSSVDLVKAWMGQTLTPLIDAQQREVLQVLTNAIQNELTDHQRSAMVEELKGSSTIETARQLGISRGALYKLTHDARRRLKLALEAAGYDACEIGTIFPR